LDRWLGEGFLKKKNIKYDMLKDEYVPYFFLGVLVCSFVGFSILKNLFDKIASISEQMSTNYITELSEEPGQYDADELHKIVQSFSTIETQFNTTFSQLEKKTSEISILKDLSELCYVTFDPEEILHVTLERSLVLTNSDLGSILMIAKDEPKFFIVKATVGLGKYVKAGDQIDFETSIAKYAVINKSPLVVEDIERDNRFGRANLAHYGTKSFVCMPIKTSKEIFGVLTISSKTNNRVYNQEDVEVLTPLLSNAAFTYENLRLIKENEQAALYVKSIDKIFKILNSSFRDSELIHAVLSEIQSVVQFDLSILMTTADCKPGHIKIFDMLIKGPSNIAKGSCYSYKNSVIEKVFKQESTLIIDDIASFDNEIDRELFKENACRSCLLAPLKTDGLVTGVLVLGRKESGVFNGVQDLINWIANGLSLAIERNKLSADVVKRNQEMDTVRQIGSALASSTFDISKVLNYTMDMIREAINVEAGSLLFLRFAALSGGG
jgi:GAF domain-containing protein